MRICLLVKWITAIMFHLSEMIRKTSCLYNLTRSLVFEMLSCYMLFNYDNTQSAITHTFLKSLNRESFIKIQLSTQNTQNLGKNAKNTQNLRKIRKSTQNLRGLYKLFQQLLMSCNDLWIREMKILHIQMYEILRCVNHQPWCWLTLSLKLIWTKKIILL